MFLSYDNLVCCQGAAYLVIRSAVNGLVQEVLVKVVVDMLMAKSASRTTSTHVSPIVVVVCNVEMSVVEIAECSVVAHKRGLPVIVEVVP
jgi:hypothetical protein